MAELKTGTDLVTDAIHNGDTVTARVCGEIDLNNTPDFRGAVLHVLLKPRPRKLILILSQVPYMDSSAVAVLVEALQALRRHQGRLFLADVQPRVKGLLEIARLHSIFHLVKDEQEAMEK